VWEGILGSEKVCVKVLRIYNGQINSQKRVLAVCGVHDFLYISLPDTAQASLRRGSSLEETETPECCTIFGCSDGVVTTRVEMDAQWHSNGLRGHSAPRGSNRPRECNIASDSGPTDFLRALGCGRGSQLSPHLSYGAWGFERCKCCICRAKWYPNNSLSFSKPNILIDGTGNARVCDFGLASIAQGKYSTGPKSDKGHTARWSAPEILFGECITSKQADIFAFGMVVVEVHASSKSCNGVEIVL